jgi:hypothetical protein
MTDLKKRDIKKLSAYLDGELNSKQSSRLEMRLKDDPQLRKALGELEATKALLGSLPQIRPPRNFTLTPEMAGLHQKRSLYPVFRLATVIVAVAFAVLVGADIFFRSSSGGIAYFSQAPEVAEVTIEMKAEEAAGMPTEEEMPQEEVGETKTLGPEDSLGAEAPNVNITGSTESPEGERSEQLATGESQYDVEPPSEPITVSPTELLPEAPPTVLERRAPEETQSEVPLSPTTAPTHEIVSTTPPTRIEPIHAVEIGLGVLVVIMGAATIILRRQS